MSEEMDGNIVLVTGSGSGIGQAAARLFAEAGAEVYGADVDETGLRHTAKLIEEKGGRFHAQRVDVSVEHEVRDLIALIEAEQGRLDVACNNAGIVGPTQLIENYPTEQFDRVVAVNLRGVFLTMKYELPLMRRAGGAICNTASVASLTGPGGLHAYAASKHAVHGLTRSAAHDYAGLGVRINAIAPGRTDTPMAAEAERDNPAFAAEAGTLPAGRVASPEEIARAMYWICSPAASYVYGHMLVVDGGATIGGPHFAEQ